GPAQAAGAGGGLAGGPAGPGARRVGVVPGPPVQAGLLPDGPPGPEGRGEDPRGDQPRRRLLRRGRPRRPPQRRGRRRARPRGRGRGPPCDRRPDRRARDHRDPPMKKLLLVLFVMWAGGAAGVWYYTEGRPRRVNFRTTRVARGDLL